VLLEIMNPQHHREIMSDVGSSVNPRVLPWIIWLLATQLLTAASLLIWFYIAGLSLMAFDGGETREAWTWVISIWSYPIIPLALVIASWVCFTFRKYRISGILSGLAPLPPFAVFLFFMLM